MMHPAGKGQLMHMPAGVSRPERMQVIRGTYTQTDQLQGFNALAPTAGQNLSLPAAVAAGPAQVPSSNIIEALSGANMGGGSSEVGQLTIVLFTSPPLP